MLSIGKREERGLCHARSGEKHGSGKPTSLHCAEGKAPERRGCGAADQRRHDRRRQRLHAGRLPQGGASGAGRTGAQRQKAPEAYAAFRRFDRRGAGQRVGGPRHHCAPRPLHDQQSAARRRKRRSRIRNRLFRPPSRRVCAERALRLLRPGPRCAHRGRCHHRGRRNRPEGHCRAEPPPARRAGGLPRYIPPAGSSPPRSDPAYPCGAAHRQHLAALPAGEDRGRRPERV